MKGFFVLLGLTLAWICVGVVLDINGVIIGGVGGLCVSVSLLLVFLTLITSAIIRRTVHGVSFGLLALIISLMLAILALTEVNLSVLWPMIPLAIFTAVSFSGIVTYRDGFTTIVGVSGLTISIGLIIATTWSYLVGGLLVFVIFLIALAVKLLKKEKKYEIPRISIVERAKKIKKEDEDK